MNVARFVRIALTFLACVTATLLTQAQAPIWSQLITGPGDPAVEARIGGARAVAFDAAGDIVVAGSHPYLNATQWMVVKLDATTHQPVWTHASSELGYGTAVAFDSAGDVYVGGGNSGIGGSGRLAKFSGSTGAQLWAITAGGFGGLESMNVKEVTIGPDGHPMFLTSFYFGALSGVGAQIHKRNKDTGAQIWATAAPIAVAMRMDAAGDLLSLGIDTGMLSLFKYTNGGSPLGGATTRWRLYYPDLVPRALTLDPNGDPVFLAEQGTGTAKVLRVIKIRSVSNNGDTLLDTTRAGQADAVLAGFAIATDKRGDIFVAGTSTAMGATKADLVLMKLAGATGLLRWSNTYTHPAGSFEGVQLAIDAAGDAVVTADISGTGGVTLNSYAARFATGSGARRWERALDVNGAREHSVAARVKPGALYTFDDTRANNPQGVWAWRVSKVFDAFPATALDFSGDRKADLLFRHTDGRDAVWLMDGLAPTQLTEIFPAGTAWRVALTPDLDGDGKADLVWQNPDGRITAYLMNGATAVVKQPLLPAGGGWAVIKTGDLDGDGKSDLVFRNADGTIAAWLMDGASLKSGATLLDAGSGWTVAHVADFDGDGKADLLWKHTDGRHAIWLMDGLEPFETVQILDAGGWTAVHAADLDGDYRADIVWQHSDGRTALWLMTGTEVANGGDILGAGTGWSVAKTGDFDGDGKSDLLFRHTDGRAAIYLMNGLVPAASAQILNAGGWTPRRVQDMNNDGKADIVWQHNDGRVAVWLMNGVTMTSGATILGAGTGWSVE